MAASENYKNPARLNVGNRFISSLLESLLGLKPLSALYDRWMEKKANVLARDGSLEAAEFLDHTLNSLQTSLQIVHEERLDSIPAEGPIIFVANHPFGGLEGMQLAQLLLEFRPDLKVLTNEILTLIPEFSDLFIGVDVLASNATAKNTSGMKQVSRHLKQGGALLVFPAGTVASFELAKARVVEKPWASMIARLARRYQATCLPMHVAGHNGFWFNFLGLFHKRLRTALLARQLTNKRNRTTSLYMGKLIDRQEIEIFRDDDSLCDYLRLHSDLLPLDKSASEQALDELNEAQSQHLPKAEMREDLDQLKDCLLLTKGQFSVYCVPFPRMGRLMHELSLVREQTFRAAGEGTGQSQDSDQFDPHYNHLFVWDDENEQLVGAYRMGECDRILSAHGVRGLYSRSLFKYKRNYIERIGGALEVGRSFVSLPYQRNPRALDMLWRGIGAFVARNPQYHTLFGCVSISSEHSAMARAFLSETMLSCYSAKAEFLTDIKPISPLKVKGRIWTRKMLETLSDIAIVNKLVGSFDPGKNIPVLLRHYLALNGRFVSFTVNHGFNQALDGLILVDLRDSPVKYLHRYLGLEGTEKFLKKWNKHEAAA